MVSSHDIVKAHVDSMRSSDPQGSNPKLFASMLVARTQRPSWSPWQILWPVKILSHSLLDFFPCRGHSPEWYSKCFGHLCASEVARIRNSFQPLIAEGPETKIWVVPSVTSNSGNKKLKRMLWQRMCVWESRRGPDGRGLCLKMETLRSWNAENAELFWELF